MNKRHACMLGLASGAVIIGGIIISVLLQQLIITVGENHVNRKLSSEWNKVVMKMSGFAWLFGLVYIVPGVLGCIAAFVQKKFMYVITCVFTMISLVIMVAAFVMAGLALIFLVLQMGTLSDHCVDSDFGCMCKKNPFDHYDNTPFRTCASLEKFVAIFISLLLFITLTWMVLLMEFIVCCCFCCCNRTTSPGVVIRSSNEPMLPPGEEMVPHYYGMGYPQPAKV